MGLTQCKKDTVENNGTPELQGEKYTIALNLGGESNAKAEIYPFGGIAPVYYTQGDIIHVAYKGVRVGQLVCNGSTIPANTANYSEASASFVGDITVDPENIDGTSPLYFYFIGNQPYGTTSGKLIVDLSDQTSELPVISYAGSVEAFATDRENYTVPNNWLMNQCALVKFEAENIYDMSANTNDNNSYAIYKTTKPVTIYGMDNHVEINLATPGAVDQFDWSQVNNGAITLYRHSSDTDGTARYAIVHQGNYTSVTAGALDVPFNPTSDPYGFFGTYKIAHNVQMNDYFDGAKLDLVWHSGAFSVAAAQNPAALDIDDDEYGTPYYIVFSRGNLQYNYTQNKWRFAKHQRDFVGGGLSDDNWMYLGNVVLNENDETSPALSSSSSDNRSDNEQINNSGYYGWIDLFGWGTGDNPTKCAQENSNYSDWHEWGAHDIVNSGKPGNTSFWYTLGRDEWQYLMEHRCGGKSGAESRIGMAIVEGVKGLILLPDNFNPASMPSGCPAWEEAGSATLVNNSWNMTFNADQWKSMELKGAAFFPAAGYRGSTVGNLYCLDFDGGSNNPAIGHNGGDRQDHGAYWSSTKATAYTDASCYYMRFGNNMVGNHVNPGYYMAPDNGNAVRLVHRVSSGSKFFKK